MMREGRGGFMDSAKYREVMTDLVWHGKAPEPSDEDKVESAKEAIGRPAPKSAVDEARDLREMLRSGKKPDSE